MKQRPRGRSRPRVQVGCLTENRKKAPPLGWRDSGEDDCRSMKACRMVGGLFKDPSCLGESVHPFSNSYSVDRTNFSISKH